MFEGCVETQDDKDRNLCKWLRENSSGFYRNSAIAASRIEELKREIVDLKAENERLKNGNDKKPVPFVEPKMGYGPGGKMVYT